LNSSNYKAGDAMYFFTPHLELCKTYIKMVLEDEGAYLTPMGQSVPFELAFPSPEIAIRWAEKRLEGVKKFMDLLGANT
jgi:hypothetical protein